MKDEEKNSGFKVSDRRPFTAEGELRNEVVEEKPAEAKATNAASASSAGATPPEPEAPAPPSASEQQAQHEAYKQSSRELDSQVERSGHSPKDFEVNFKSFLASFYMTAMLQLGLMHERGGSPQVDIIGARQTIDTIGLLAEKTKGNLTPEEKNFLENALYELRMAYVEVTNALAHPPEQAKPGTGTTGR